MFRSVLIAGALALGIAAIPAKVTLVDDTLAITGSDAMAQRTMSDPRYQPGSGSCRDGAGRRC